MKRRGLWLLFLAACQAGAGEDDAPAPAASNIPRAAPSATGAAYAPPTTFPTAFPGTSPPTPPQPPGFEPFRHVPPPPPGGMGGGTHL